MLAQKLLAQTLGPTFLGFHFPEFLSTCFHGSLFRFLLLFPYWLGISHRLKGI